MRWALRQARRLVILAVMLAGGIWATLSSGDPDLYPATDYGERIVVVDHGYHTGIVVPTRALRAAAVRLSETDPAAARRLMWLVQRFPAADWIEVGWGDRAFYQDTPGIGDVDLWLAAQALFWPTPSVLQVVPGYGRVSAAFPFSDRAELSLSPDGFLGLAARLAKTTPEPTDALAPSLYGQGAFYPATLDYHLFRTCNHWTAWVLRGAGVPASPVPGTFSTTLMAELRWRAVP